MVSERQKTFPIEFDTAKQIVSHIYITNKEANSNRKIYFDRKLHVYNYILNLFYAYLTSKIMSMNRIIRKNVASSCSDIGLMHVLNICTYSSYLIITGSLKMGAEGMGDISDDKQYLILQRGKGRRKLRKLNR